MEVKKRMGTDNNIQDIHRLVVCSDLRKNILHSLNEGNKSLGNLREDMNISSTTAIHALRELEKFDITFQDKNKKYALTNIGKIVVLKLLDFDDAAEVLKKHNRFWLDHDLSGIPQFQMGKIGWLKDSNIVVINPLDIIKTHESYIAFIKTANWIKGVSSIYSSDYEKIFKKVIEKNITIELVLTVEVFKKLTNTMGLDNFNNLIHNHPINIFLTDENLKVAFTITDAFFSLGLFTKDNVYDITHDLISTDDFAIRWGDELFEYYRRRAKKYEIKYEN
jgi:predicted transcriptional regulator